MKAVNQNNVEHVKHLLSNFITLRWIIVIFLQYTQVCSAIAVLLVDAFFKLESSHSPQVPPPKQCYSPGDVTIFTLPAVPLCPL